MKIRRGGRESEGGGGGGVGLGRFMDEKSRCRARPRKYTTYSGKAKICVESDIIVRNRNFS